MDKRIKKEWVEALRSGDYVQTKGYLNDSTGHCCLGVLCEIAIKDGVIKKRETESGFFEFDGQQQMPGEKVADWCGLAYRNMCILTEMNDEEEATFEQIADYIEGNF